MKRLIITTASLFAIAHSATALAEEAAAETAEEAVDPSVSGMLPGDEGNPAPAQDPAADTTSSAEEAPTTDKRSAKNAIYLDLAGPGLFYSINYDRVLTDDLSARIGLSYFSAGASAGGASASFSYLAIPLTVSYLGIGSAANIFEVGGGGTFMRVEGSGVVDSGEDSVSGGGSVTVMALTGIAGYRHQDPEGGFVFRIGVSPLVLTTGDVLPWGYLSLGAAF